MMELEDSHAKSLIDWENNLKEPPESPRFVKCEFCGQAFDTHKSIECICQLT